MPPMFVVVSENNMTAQIIRLSRPEKGEKPAALHGTANPARGALLPGAARRWWYRARLTVETFGWIVVAASIIASAKA